MPPIGLLGAWVVVAAALLPLAGATASVAVQASLGVAFALAALVVGIDRAAWLLIAAVPLLLALQGAALPLLLRGRPAWAACPRPALAAATVAMIVLAAACLPAGAARAALLPGLALLLAGLLTMAARQGTARLAGLLAVLQAPLFAAIVAPAPALVAILSPALAAVAVAALRRARLPA